MFAKVLTGIAGTALVAGAVAFSKGAIAVKVQEKKPDGTNIRLILPAAAVPWGIRLAPQREMHHAMREAREWLPVMKTVGEELERCPDAVFVEVETSEQHVRVEKVGNRLVVDVDTPRETVHVSFPVRTISSAVRQLERANPET